MGMVLALATAAALLAWAVRRARRRLPPLLPVRPLPRGLMGSPLWASPSPAGFVGRPPQMED